MKKQYIYICTVILALSTTGCSDIIKNTNLDEIKDTAIEKSQNIKKKTTEIIEENDVQEKIKEVVNSIVDDDAKNLERKYKKTKNIDINKTNEKKEEEKVEEIPEVEEKVEEEDKKKNKNTTNNTAF